MNKAFVSFVLVCLALMMGCATSEERAVQKAEYAKKVVAALSDRNYTIGVDRMIPMKGGSKSVSYGYSVEVRNDSLISYLPYIGRAYNVPYGGGKGLNFSERIGSYQESQKNNGLRHIEISLTNDEDTYHYIIEVFDNGNSTIDVQSRQREPISYTGQMTIK